MILFDFFEKPMSTNMVLHAKTAQSQSVKFASLTQEVVRRLLHTSRMLPLSNRMENLERLATKMATSGHKPKYIRSVMIAGIIKFEKKFMKSQYQAATRNTSHYILVNTSTAWEDGRPRQWVQTPGMRARPRMTQR